MDKTELLYDHYKETVRVSTDMQAKRNTLFVYVCVFELLNFLMLLFPQVINSALSAFLLEAYKVSLSELLGLLPTGIWLTESLWRESLPAGFSGPLISAGQTCDRWDFSVWLWADFFGTIPQVGCCVRSFATFGE